MDENYFVFWRFFCCILAVFKDFLISVLLGSIVRLSCQNEIAASRLPSLYACSPFLERAVLQFVSLELICAISNESVWAKPLKSG